jgi:predicted metal-binding protein
MKKIKIGIIICDRYKGCAGGKCFQSAYKKEGAFEMYKDVDIEIAGYTSCGGCPGGNVEYAPEEMKKNGIEVIHLATGLLVGFPPCPYIDHFKHFISEKYGLKVVVGTHPIPQKYLITHNALESWNNDAMQKNIQMTICDEHTRLKYD